MMNERSSSSSWSPMAEARAAVGAERLRVFPDLDEGRDSVKDVVNAVRKSFVRRFFRLRNSIRNGTWPTSTHNLTIAFVATFSFMMMAEEVPPQEGVNGVLWSFSHKIPLVPDGTPRWFRAFLTSWILALAFFVLLMKARQYALRALLSYRGWLYEDLKSQSKRTFLWGLLVRMISGYAPSLYSCQRSLPRLPVPGLRSTLTLLLESLKPICSESEWEEMRAEGEAWASSKEAARLQRILILKSWWVPNYVTDWWEKYVYLMNRSSLAINSNYYGMDHSYWSPTSSMTARAGVVLHQILVFKRSVDREDLGPLLLRSTIPICMGQYERLFSSVRVPGREVDELRHYDSAESKHVVVNYLGIYYKVECYDIKNQILAPSSLQAQFEWIIKDAESQLKSGEVSESARSISALTALPRDEWAGIWKSYFSRGVNRKSASAIEKAIAMVILSDKSPTSLNDRGKALLHGEADGRNLPWYDKTMNVVFFKNGHCGLNVEHTPADAPVCGHMWEYAMTKEIIEKWYTDDGAIMPMPKSFRQAPTIKPVRLHWAVTAELEEVVENAISFSEEKNGDLDLEIGDHSSWGKGLIKRAKVSPDAFIQIALQLAYYKDAGGTFAQTYEASMTRLYSNGRTETVRSCSVEMVDFIRALGSTQLSKDEKIGLLRRAADKHQRLYRDAMNGMGIDRHLFALYVLSKGLNYEAPFLEKVLMKPWTLSTSQQPQQQLIHVPDINLPLFADKVCPGGGFGPVADNGYGVSYMLPSDHRIFFHVTSKFSSPSTSSKRFLGHLFDSLDELRRLFDLQI